MTTNQSARKCASICWYVSVGIGLLLAIALIADAQWAFLWGTLVGVLAFLVMGFILPQLICTGPAQRPMAATSVPSSLVAGDPPAPMPGGPHTAAASAAAATPPYTEDEAAPQAHPIASEAKKPKSKPDAGSDGGSKPDALSAPRKEGADDLKLIKGVGPKLEAELHEMGYYHFDQIAKWSDAEVAWIDQNVQGIRSRASRDDWTGQAAALASGAAPAAAPRAPKSGAS